MGVISQVVTGATLVVTGALLVVTKKLLVTGALLVVTKKLVVTGALLVVTKKLVETRGQKSGTMSHVLTNLRHRHAPSVPCHSESIPSSNMPAEYGQP